MISWVQTERDLIRGELDDVEVIDGPRLRKSFRVDDHSDPKVSQTCESGVHPSNNGSDKVVVVNSRTEPSLREEPSQKTENTKRKGKGRGRCSCETEGDVFCTCDRRCWQ